MPIHAVVFDRDGVLTDFDLEKATRFFTPRVPLSVWEIAARWNAWGQQFGFPRDLAGETTFFHTFWDALCDEFALTPEVRADLHRFDYTSCLLTFPDVRPALEVARAAGLRTGVLSNFSLASLDASLAATGLSHLVDAACAATVIGVAKPDPAAYRMVAERLDVALADCLFFDDEVVCVEGGRRAGMTAYRVDRSRRTHALAEGIVADLSALRLLLQRLG
jgi:putative hydrolase of the HAD superfamily